LRQVRVQRAKARVSCADQEGAFQVACGVDHKPDEPEAARLEEPAPDNQIVQDAYLGGQGGSSRAVEERIRAKRRQILG